MAALIETALGGQGQYGISTGISWIGADWFWKAFLGMDGNGKALWVHCSGSGRMGGEQYELFPGVLSADVRGLIVENTTYRR